MSKVKIEIKNRFTGSVLFEYEKEHNTIKETVERAIKVEANLEGANLRGANLRGADLEGAYLGGANLRGADLEGADLEGANLRGADLEGANLRGANLRGADLEGADLEGANLRGAYLYLSDCGIDADEIINNFEENTGLKIKEWYINHDIVPTRWNFFWENGLIIREYEEKEKEIKKMTVSQICEELGYEVEIVREEESLDE